MSHFLISTFFFINFGPIKIDLFGNTVLTQKLVKIDNFGTFSELLSTQSVVYEFSNFGIFYQILSNLKWTIW